MVANRGSIDGRWRRWIAKMWQRWPTRARMSSDMGDGSMVLSSDCGKIKSGRTIDGDGDAS